jgi:hypothetical protein
MPPKLAIVESTTRSTPSIVDTSACTVATMFGRRAAASTSRAASASVSAPRAHRHTRQPDETSDRALASPRPRLEPVTIATLSVSPKSMRYWARPPVRSFRLQSKRWNTTLNWFCSANSRSSGSRFGMMKVSSARSIGDRDANGPFGS